MEDMKVFKILAFVAAGLMIISGSLWGDVLNFGVDGVRIAGCLMFMVSFVYLVFFALIAKAMEEGKPLAVIFSVIAALAICVSVFSFFCFMNLVPGMPQTEAAKTIYGWLSLGLIIGGGASAGGSVIIIFL